MQESTYGSHAPILKLIAGRREVQRVVEFGSGTHSTLTFLNEAIFKDLTSLITMEDDKKWLPRAVDERWTKIVCDPTEFIGKVPRDEPPDMIFIDNGPTFEERRPLIEPSVPLCDFVVLHDCGGFAEIIRRQPHHKIFSKEQTAVISKESLGWLE
jgi:hypothetical protein